MKIPNNLITKIGAGGAMVAGIAGFVTGTMSLEAAIATVSAGVAAFGLERKMERTAVSAEHTAQTAVATQSTVENAVVIAEVRAHTAEEAADATTALLEKQNRLFVLGPKKR